LKAQERMIPGKLFPFNLEQSKSCDVSPMAVGS
jgi:hypothetical protein